VRESRGFVAEYPSLLGSLVDLLFTSTLSRYHDANLRSMQERLPVRSNVLTRCVSARQTFPDAFYEFNRSGKMVWKVDSSLLTLTDQVGALRNVCMLLLPAAQRVHFAAMFSRLQVCFKLENGAITLLGPVPVVRFELLPDLTLKASTNGVAGVTHAWDFGDGQGFSEGDSLERPYRKPGTYTVTLRVVRDGRLMDFKANVAVSRTHAFVSPMTVLPVLTLNAGKVTVNASAAVGKMLARIGDQTGSVFQLADGEHTFDFVAARALRFRAYCDQRHQNTVVLDPGGLNLASNRRFDDVGANVTGVTPNPPANEWTKQLFEADARGVLSPEDNWTLELNLNDKPELMGVTLPDVAQLDLSELQDVVLALEYETIQGR
jgi:PKD domain